MPPWMAFSSMRVSKSSCKAGLKVVEKSFKFVKLDKRQRTSLIQAKWLILFFLGLKDSYMISMKKRSIDNYIGCIVGGAIGDALGAPTEFMNLEDILEEYGPNGVNDYVEYDNGYGFIPMTR